MSRREVIATSGTTLTLRFFAGANLPEDLAQTGDLEAAYENGVPMGGALNADAGAPRLFVWATQDPDYAPLAKIQIIKGWLEDAEARE